MAKAEGLIMNTILTESFARHDEALKPSRSGGSKVRNGDYLG